MGTHLGFRRLCAESHSCILASPEAHSVQVLALCSSSMFTIAAAYGLGNHLRIVELSPHLPDAILYKWVAAVLDSFSIGFVKLSVLSYLLDIQGPTHRLGRWILYLAVSINVCFQCTERCCQMYCN